MSCGTNYILWQPKMAASGVLSSVVKVALAPMISGPLSSTSEPASQKIQNYYSAEMQAKTHIINGGSTFRLDGRDMVGQLNKASVSIFPERSKLVKGQEREMQALKDQMAREVKRREDLVEAHHAEIQKFQI